MKNDKSSFKIQTIHAFICTEDDGTEGVIGMLLPNGRWMPFICADPVRMEELRPIAQQFAQEHDKHVVLARFSVREDIEEIK